MLNKKIDIPFGLFCLALIIYLIAMPKAYHYNADIFISPFGMALSQGYSELPFSFTKGISGYINDGIFCKYTNWPPVGFLLTSLWMKLFGTEVYNVRIFYILLNAISVVLFYLILKQSNLRKSVTIISSTIFVLLPYHIIYSSLVYADSWTLFFWLCTLLIFTNSKWQKISVPVIALMGTLFTWHSFFMLPAYILMKLLSKTTIKNKKILLLCTTSLAILLFETASIYLFSKYMLIQKLHYYSFFNTPKHYLPLIKRLVNLIFEFAPLLSLSLFSFVLNTKTKNQKKLNKLKDVTFLMALCLYIYILAMPTWFAIHTHQILFFDIVIALGIALILEQLNLKNINLIGFGLVTLCISLYFFIPLLSKQYPTKKENDSKIANYINNNKEQNKKVCLFFDLKNNNSDKSICTPFVLRSLCDAYIFNKKYLGSTIQYVSTGLKSLKKYPVKPFSENVVFYISETTGNIPSYLISDSLSVKQAYIYKIKKPYIK